MRKITTTYAKIDTESSKQGDFSDTGWIDEDGESIELDKWDIEEGLTVIDKALDFLKDQGAISASSSYFHPGIWYSTEFQIEDYSTDEEVEYSFHLEGFTEVEEKEIYEKFNNQ